MPRGCVASAAPAMQNLRRIPTGTGVIPIRSTIHHQGDRTDADDWYGAAHTVVSSSLVNTYVSARSASRAETCERPDQCRSGRGVFALANALRPTTRGSTLSRES
jgi:hypothetical protein